MGSDNIDVAILYDEWFNNKNYWFSKDIAIDTYLCNKYMRYIDETNEIYNNYLNGIKYDKKTLISCVLLLDQIPRHYKRVYENEIDVSQYSQYAIYFAELLLNSYDDTELSIDELCFVYLPYRHINDIGKIYEIIEVFIKLYNTRNGSDKTKCKRYLNAMLNNIYQEITKLYENNYLICKSWKNLNMNIFDKQSLIYRDNRGYINENSNVYLCVSAEIAKLNDNSTIIISLSGGVDSMVALYVMKILCDSEARRKKIKNIIAVHINYNNRVETQDELDFVNYYCNLLGVRLFFRTIREIKRDDCMNNGLRDLYEDITKKIRYDMYRCNTHNPQTTYVLLGHNKDDCFENIITNISNKNNYNNLCGMETLANIDGINFWRPMLNVKKGEIIEFANCNNIPYLFDSTPTWSVRGKIRDKLTPVMCSLKSNNSRDDNSSAIDAFFSLKEHVANTNEIINTVIIDNLIAKLNIFQDSNDSNDSNSTSTYSTVGDSGTYIGTYNKSEISSLKYVSISYMFFQRLHIRVSHKTMKDFAQYITRYLENNCAPTFTSATSAPTFVLNKNNKLKIKNMDNGHKILINF